MDRISIGINIGHDRSVAVVKNGLLVGSLAQERVDRIKHSTGLSIPYEAIDTLLQYLNISIQEIRYIGITSTAVNIPDLIPHYFSELERHYHISNFKLFPVAHHLAHAASTFYTSGFDKSLILIADGGGDIVGTKEESESVFIGNGNRIELLERRLQSNYIHTLTRPQMHIYPFMNKEYSQEPISIGKKYSQFTALLSLGTHGEGKTMGLAPYGKSLLNIQLPQLNSFNFELTFADLLREIYQKFLISGLSYFEFMQLHAADIASTIQDYTEQQIMRITEYLIQKYKPDNLCLAGGLFLNCPLNYNIIKTFPHLHVHICPAAGDDGQAIGAAFEANKIFTSPVINTSQTLPFTGLSYHPNEIEQALKKRNLKYYQYSYKELASFIAKYIYKDQVVGLLRGRSEAGPRALCHRSILANPCSPNMKDHLNKHIKHREEFRPFAPVVISEQQSEYFELNQDSPYMLLAANVKQEYRSCLPAITHVDGSARIQSVKKGEDEFVYDLLKEFKKLSGFPILLNTSFNDFNEPMVESPTDAICTFLSTNIDILVLENYLIKKEDIL